MSLQEVADIIRDIMKDCGRSLLFLVELQQLRLCSWSGEHSEPVELLKVRSLFAASYSEPNWQLSLIASHIDC